MLCTGSSEDPPSQMPLCQIDPSAQIGRFNGISQPNISADVNAAKPWHECRNLTPSTFHAFHAFRFSSMYAPSTLLDAKCRMGIYFVHHHIMMS